MIQGMPCLTWDDFKATCITKKNLTCQYFEAEKTYELFGQDGIFLWSYAMLKVDPKSDEQIDFEDNHRSNFNWVIGSGRPYSFSTSDFDYAGNRTPKTELTDWTAGEGGDSYADIFFKVPESGLYLNGGKLLVYSGWAAGDWAEMFITDKDGIFPEQARLLFPNYPILKKWVRGTNIEHNGAMGICECHTPYAGNPMASTYLCIRLHRANSNNRTVGANFNLHKAI